ncbi:hypothetical protein [Blastococcus mobilis]|uniref:Uncharacterized protein n=1 Tax=Blastococcus mobilis TaxID=1938746 RepID=A0A238URQ0_9ACTN|nr:hypothetical protein [Blastococcus mobilis]SNR24820.1 hypothetical protein SAMN06272737_101293 [Blastococcus mobilis]
MTHDESADRSAVVPWREPSVPPARRPGALRAAARTLERARPARVAAMLPAGPLLGASAIAVFAAVAGRAIRIATGAARPAREQPPRKAVARRPSPPGAGPDVLVTWTSVEIRWTSGR